MSNKKYKALRNTLITLFVFVGIFLYGLMALNNSDGYGNDGYYALLFVTFFAIVACLAVIPMFVKRKKSFDNALDPSTQFAMWKLDDTLVEKTARKKLANDKERNKAMITIVTFFFVLFTVLFAFMLDDDEILMFIVVMISINLIIVAFALLMPIVFYRNVYMKAKEVYLGENAIIIGNELHIFKSAFETFKSAEFDEDKSLLIIHYTSLSRTGRVPYDAQVPVPSQYRQTALAYINMLN